MNHDSHPRSALWRVPGLLVLAAVAVGAITIAASARDVRNLAETRTFPASDAVVVTNHLGDTVVRGSARADITVASAVKYTGGDPHLVAEFARSRLLLTVECGEHIFAWDLGVDDFGLGRLCTVRREIAVPSATNLTLETATGDVLIAGSTAPAISVHSGTGDIEVTLRDLPDDVEIGTGTGDITLRLPLGVYEIDAETATGDVRIADGIIDAEVSSARISLATGTGDIRVERSDV